MAGTGPRRLDPHHASKLTPVNLDRYRTAVRGFINWIDVYNLQPSTAEHFDDLLIEWKNARLAVLATEPIPESRDRDAESQHIFWGQSQLVIAAAEAHVG